MFVRGVVQCSFFVKAILLYMKYNSHIWMVPDRVCFS